MLFKTFGSSHQSLADHCTDLLFEKGIGVRKQSLDNRFNDNAVRFLKGIVSRLSPVGVPPVKSPLLSKFSGVFIQDATRFGLPPSLKGAYPGFGGAGAVSGGQIQLVYDLKNGAVIQTDLVAATVNEAKNATGCDWVQEG